MSRSADDPRVVEIMGVLDRALQFRPRFYGYGTGTTEALLDCLLPDMTWTDESMRVVILALAQHAPLGDLEILLETARHQGQANALAFREIEKNPVEREDWIKALAEEQAAS